MNKELNFLECWISVATDLFSQAMAGEPVLVVTQIEPMPQGSFGFSTTFEGDEEGRFSVVLDGALAEASLLGEGVDQKAAWEELLKGVTHTAARELRSRSGKNCEFGMFRPVPVESQVSNAFLLKSGERSWVIQVKSELRSNKSAKFPESSGRRSLDEKGSQIPRVNPSEPATPSRLNANDGGLDSASPRGTSTGFELLLDVELEASLRFGAREMPLSEILELGPGDVVQLDRNISDPVDLLVGDKIVARGEVVLVNGYFGLRVTEVAEPQRRLESVRCLF